METAFNYENKCETCRYFSYANKETDDYVSGPYCAIQTFLEWREGGAWTTANDTQAKRTELDTQRKQYRIIRVPVANSDCCDKYQIGKKNGG